MSSTCFSRVKTTAAGYLEHAGLLGALAPCFQAGLRSAGSKDQQGLPWTDPPAANQFDKNREDMGVEGLPLVFVANDRVQDVMIIAFWAPRTAAT